ncbi:MAG: hypothetical protein ABIS36_13405 [Chryseolinea sp.]
MRPKQFYLFPLIFLLASLIVMVLWNNVLVDVAPVNRIHFMQAAGILVFSRMLFGRFLGSSYYIGRKCRFGPPPHVREKWMTMSDEERQKFREAWKRRTGRS